MIGAIAGDIIGSVYEHHNITTTEFLLFSRQCTFTDDTVLTVAVADVVLTGADYGAKLKEYFRAYPGRGYYGRTSRPGILRHRKLLNGLEWSFHGGLNAEN